MDKTIGILTFEEFHGRANIGSTRIRVKWPLNYWPEAEEYLMGQKYDVVIYQKAYWLEGMEILKKLAPGKHIKILDICDADWLHWGYRIKQCIDQCDAVTTSTVAIAEFLVKYTDKPVWCIPDRLDFATFGDLKKDHTGKGRAKIAAWYGYNENFPMLNDAIGALVDTGFEELIVISGRRSPYQLPAGYQDRIRLINLPWTPETANLDLLKADVVINPQKTIGRWKYKSNNKTINAWALGMPVAMNKAHLLHFMDENNRTKEGNFRYDEAREKYNVKDSVAEYRALIDEIKQTKL